jgi:uncharacterized protein YdeI (YjbR/CyaY-like superfamily)
MSAFKQHCMFGFWLHRPLLASLTAADQATLTRLRHIESVDHLPDDRTLTRIIKAGARLHDAGVKRTRDQRTGRPMPKRPPALVAALKKHARAQARFDAASPSFQREYIDWILDAKSDDTRQRRLETAVAWIAEGKGRNWKYEKKK